MRHTVLSLLSLVSLALLAPTASADTLGTIKARGALVIGFREGAPPFSTLGPDKKPQGYSIDLCNRIAESVKAALQKPNLPVRYVPVTAENRIAKLESGAIDIECGSTTRTISRQERVDFTLFTFLTGTEMLVPSNSPIHDAQDLAGKKIALQPGTTTERVMKQLFSLRLINAEIVPVASSQEGLAAVESGKVDGYASDEIVLIGLAASAKDPKSLRLSGTLYSYEPYALMVRKNDAAFRLIADRMLAYLFQSGEILDIYRRWFGGWRQEPTPLQSALFSIESLAP